MRVSSSFLFRTTITLLGVMLAITAFVAINVSQRADALSGPPGGEWGTVLGYVDGYIQSQYDKGPDGAAGTADDPAEGEAGFVMDRTALKNRIDSNGDMNMLGEGDDAANAPVLIDNLSQSNVIPGTSIQCLWNGGIGSINCFDVGKVNAIKAKVDGHKAAGFSTDVVFYCSTGHTEAPTTGGFGPISQAGGLASDGSVSRVYAFKWGIAGWTGSAPGYSNSGPTGPSDDPDINAPYPDAGNPAVCNGKTPDSELVRCTAQWAIYNGNVAAGTWGPGSPTAGGNLGQGQTPSSGLNGLDLNVGQIVDIRASSPAATIADPNTPTNQIPLNILFNSGRNRVNSTLTPANGVLVAGRTQMGGGIAAVGLKMLGYPMASNGFLRYGMPGWNNTMAEKQVSAPAYSTVPKSSIDNAAPAISNVTALGGPAGSNSASITWQTNEPATTVVEYRTSQSGQYTRVATGCDKNGNAEPCTVLRGNHSLTLTGIAENTTYYYRVTSYDGQANVTTSTEGAFYAPCAAGQPVLSASLGNVRWASPADYVNRLISVDVNVVNDGATLTAYDVRITGSTATQGVTLNTAVPVSMGNIPPGPPVVQTLKYQLPVNPLIPVMVPGFDATVDLTARDECGSTYGYQGQGYVEVPLLP